MNKLVLLGIYLLLMLIVALPHVQFGENNGSVGLTARTVSLIEGSKVRLVSPGAEPGIPANNLLHEYLDATPIPGDYSNAISGWSLHGFKTSAGEPGVALTLRLYPTVSQKFWTPGKPLHRSSNTAPLLLMYQRIESR